MDEPLVFTVTTLVPGAIPPPETLCPGARLATDVMAIAVTPEATEDDPVAATTDVQL